MLPEFFLSKQEICGGYQLQRKNHGNADIKLGMLGFMPENLHTRICTDTAADKGAAHKAWHIKQPA